MSALRQIGFVFGLVLLLPVYLYAEDRLTAQAIQLANLIKNDVLITRTAASDLMIEFGRQAEYPSAKFPSDQLDYPADVLPYRYFAVTLRNLDDLPLEVHLRLDPQPTEPKLIHRQFKLSLRPHEKRRFLIPIKTDAIIGMRGQPPGIDLTSFDELLTTRWPLDAHFRVSSFQLFTGAAAKGRRVVFESMELLGDSSQRIEKFVDSFGQYRYGDWPGKLNSEADFAARRKAEAAELQKQPSLVVQNRFGGWAGGPKQRATGRFRVAKIDGKWWLVDPDGCLFWSSGITGAGSHGMATRVGQREWAFGWLPPRNERWKARYSGWKGNTSFDFFGANLMRKYGDDFETIYPEIVTRRYRSWGVNTLANWSQPTTFDEARVPYVIPVHPRGSASFIADSHVKAGLVKNKHFQDPFDPSFPEALRRAFADLKHRAGDPWLLGVFVDNELPWTVQLPSTGKKSYPLAMSALMVNEADAPIKQFVAKQLRKKYPTIEALNQAWKTDFGDWSDLSSPFAMTAQQADAAVGDFDQWTALIADQYFKTVAEIVRGWDPNTLYLGARFSRYTPSVVAVAAKYCDVVSFNIYAYLPDEKTADELAVEHDFPVIIGEFHFGALDRGMFDQGLRMARDQQDRAAKYLAYMEAAVTAPWCIGAHWFQYKDQPLTGRADGENYNIGFVNAVDSPYPEMVEAARQFHRRMYTMRFEANQ